MSTQGRREFDIDDEFDERPEDLASVPRPRERNEMFEGIIRVISQLTVEELLGEEPRWGREGGRQDFPRNRELTWQDEEDRWGRERGRQQDFPRNREVTWQDEDWWGRERGRQDFFGYESQQPKPSRADIVINGLEQVSKTLLSRYEVVKGRGHPERALCAVCLEPLDLDPSHDVEIRDPLGPIRTGNTSTLPCHDVFQKVVAFPCLHIFHSECLTPWLAKKTTCPTCRFDVDPHSLTLNGGSAQQPWVPPTKGMLKAWVQAEEERRASYLRPSSLEPKAPLPDPHTLPRGVGDQTDEGTTAPGISCTHHGDEHRVSSNRRFHLSFGRAMFRRRM